MDLGAPELIIILAVVLLLFGSAKVPQLARSLGQAKREFESASKDSDKEAKKEAAVEAA
jgi:sec-independent protein translocase protein TatA